MLSRVIRRTGVMHLRPCPFFGLTLWAIRSRWSRLLVFGLLTLVLLLRGEELAMTLSRARAREANVPSFAKRRKNLAFAKRRLRR